MYCQRKNDPEYAKASWFQMIWFQDAFCTLKVASIYVNFE